MPVTCLPASGSGPLDLNQRGPKSGLRMPFRNSCRYDVSLQGTAAPPSLIATERVPLHRLAKFLSGPGLLLLSLDGGFLVVFPSPHLLEQAILEHQLLQRLERWLDLIVAHVDLHGANSLGDVSAVGRTETSRA